MMFKSLSLWALAACMAPALATVTYTQQSLKYDMFTVTQGGNTDLHMNISIDASNGWGAIGVGSGMIGALMFILVPDSTNGSTISVRSTSDYVMPTQLKDVSFTQMGGSAENGVLKASGICHGCQKWDSGTLDPTSTSQGFIWAIGPGTGGVQGTGAGATLFMHSVMGTFNFDLTQASLPASGDTASAANGGSSSGNSGVSGASGPVKSVDPMMLVAHATLLCLAFLLLFPLGVVFVRIPALGWKAHAVVQSLGFVLVVAGMGVAISMSMGTEYASFKQAHQGIGLTATSIIILQFFLGIVHHYGFQRYQKRWTVTHLHLWSGRVAMALGVINPILGFQLSGINKAAIGVGVVGCAIYVIVFAFAFFAKHSQKNKAAAMDGSSTEQQEKGMMQK